MTERRPAHDSRRQEIRLDDRIRGVPPGTEDLAPDAVGALGWHPADGRMTLPVLTLDEAAFRSNRDAMLGYARQQGVLMAPHAKTPMIPALARALIEGGAWGATVADIRQAAVMLRAGITRLILANEVGGPAAARRLAALLARFPEAEVAVFADSPEAVAALAGAWAEAPTLRPLPVLVELGAGRAGCRSLAGADELADAVLAADDRLRLAGVATYEGTAAQAHPDRPMEMVDALLDLTGETVRHVRRRAGPQPRLLVTAGGSVLFDRVVAALKPVVEADGNADLVLRSGAIFFHDHGVYERGLAALDERGGFVVDGAAGSAARAFRPSLRLWAEVLSRPEPGLVICGMGMRDVSFDQGFPKPLAVHRSGTAVPAPAGAAVTRLNDQHAFLDVEARADIRVGDVVEFGISHPCTCLDRYRVIYGVDGTGHVRRVHLTEFG